VQGNENLRYKKYTFYIIEQHLKAKEIQINFYS
jgi:hypothetical protein